MEHRGYDVGVRHPVLLNEVKEALGRPLVHHHKRAAAVQGADGTGDRHAVVKGPRGQADQIGVQRVPRVVTLRDPADRTDAAGEGQLI